MQKFSGCSAEVAYFVRDEVVVGSNPITPTLNFLKQMSGKITKILFIFFALMTFISCSEKQSEENFDKLSNEEKISLLDAKIKHSPKDADLYYQRGKVFSDMGNTKEALLNFQKAAMLNPSKVEYYIAQADVFFARGETTLAFNSLQSAIDKNPKSVEARLKSAELSLYLKDYDRCMKDVENVLQLDKLNAKAFFLQGWVFKETGDTNRAVKSYKKAIELKSDYEQPFEELGLLYAIKGDGLAVDYLKSTIKINPKNVNAMALFYQDHDAQQQALDLYQRILEIKPDYADVIHNVGWINYQYKQDYNTALDCFTKAIKADSNFYQAWYNRGKTYEKLGQMQQAKEDFARADSLKKQQGI